MGINLHFGFYGLFLGFLLAYIRGRNGEEKILTFIFGFVIGGSSGPLLVIDNTKLIFLAPILGSISLGAFSGLIIGLNVMNRIYEREHRRAINKD